MLKTYLVRMGTPQQAAILRKEIVVSALSQNYEVKAASPEYAMKVADEYARQTRTNLTALFAYEVKG